MTYKKYYDLVRDAMECESAEQFIGEVGCPEWAPEDANQFVADLTNIWEVAHMSIKDMRAAVGMTQVKFAERFAIPLRTIENWETRGGRAEYDRLMMADLLGLVTVTRAMEDKDDQQ